MQRADFGGEVVAPCAVVRRTRRTTRRPVRAARRRRAARVGGRATASRIESATSRPADAGERGRDLGRSFTERDDAARMRSAAPASAERSSPLLRPPASSTTESNAATACSGRVRVRRLRVVEVTAPHHARRPERRGGAWSRTSASASRTPPIASRRPRTRPPRAASAFVRSCGSARRMSSTVANACPSASADASPATWKRARPRRAASRHADRARPAPRAATADAIASSPSNTSRSSSRLVREDPRLRGDVVLEAPVPVEMVLGRAEQHRDARPERLGERELERRHLGDEHVDVVVDRLEQGAADVAGRDRAHARTRRASPR